MNTVKRTERGWAGHFICSNRCQFRRNTLLEYSDIKIVVSTVGLMQIEDKDGNYRIEKIGDDRHYETMVFHSDYTDTRYYDIDVQRQITFTSEWRITERDADDKANDMHEVVVNEITERLLN